MNPHQSSILKFCRYPVPVTGLVPHSTYYMQYRQQLWRAIKRKHQHSLGKGVHHGTKVSLCPLQSQLKAQVHQNPAEQSEWTMMSITWWHKHPEMVYQEPCQTVKVNRARSDFFVPLSNQHQTSEKGTDYQRHWGNETCRQHKNDWSMEHSLWTAQTRCALMWHSADGVSEWEKVGCLLESNSKVC